MRQQTIYPRYEQIQLFEQVLVGGYASLGMLQKLRPDCLWITPDQWQDRHDYRWLDTLIKKGLKQNKNVCVVCFDEDIMAQKVESFSQVLNNYANDAVWLITMLDDQDQKIYTFQHGIRCKILEIPWIFLNDCLAYERVSKRIKTSCHSHHNYLCMLGRYASHKFDLAKQLFEQGLDKFGLITVSDSKVYPKEAMDFCQINPMKPYQNLSTPWHKMAAQHKLDDIWVSANVANYLHIEVCYADIPLIIHADTSCGIFPNTEKSLWPLLLGKLMLVHGRAGNMRSMQRFYDVDFSIYADLVFDQQNNDWSEQGHRARLKSLIDLNRSLIQDCRDVYLALQPQLEQARWNLGRNIYAFVVKQLKNII